MTDNVIEPGTCYWCGKHCGGNCLGVNHPGGPKQMVPEDPAYWMLKDGHTSTPQVYRESCYICRDPEFAQMGLPLCQPCPQCSKAKGEPAGHISADDESCDDCDYSYGMEFEEERESSA